MKKQERAGLIYVYRFSFFIALFLFVVGLTITLQSGVSLQSGVFRVLVCVIAGFAIGLVIGHIFLNIARDVLEREDEAEKIRKAEAAAELLQERMAEEVETIPEEAEFSDE
jgi:uncharacterized membrane protein YraQ (UPF0718 family)